MGRPSRNSRSVRDVLLLAGAWRMRPGQARAGRPASALGADRTQDDGDGSSRSNSRLGFQRINSHGLRPDWPDFLLAAGEARGLLLIPALADEMATGPPACPAGTGAMSKREGHPCVDVATARHPTNPHTDAANDPRQRGGPGPRSQRPGSPP